LALCLLPLFICRMQSLQSVLFECRDADGSKVFKLEDRLNVKIEHGRKK